MDYFDKQNEHFFVFLNETFQFKKLKTWDDIAKSITLKKIKKTYKVFAQLFPQNFNYIEELKKNNSSFSSLHFGQIKANKIIDEVVRFSLYSEKILVFHPLQNPSVTNQQLDPRKNPKYWLPDFLEALYFYITIQKWVKAGIIKLIINPVEYDFYLMEKITAEAKARILKLDKHQLIALDGDIVSQNLAEQLARYYKGRNREFILDEMLKMKQPLFTKDEAVKMTDEIIKSIPRINPLYEKLNIPLNTGMLSTIKSGGSLESIILVSEAAEANIYTPSESNWHQIKEIGLNDFWLKLNHLYSKIELPFLNNVDTNFALELRKEDRLVGVRQELKKIYSELNSMTIDNLSESKIRIIQDGFLESIKKAESEWVEIKKQADNSRKKWMMANVGIPLINNEITLMPLIIGSLAWLYYNEKGVKDKQKAQRIKNPTSVFIDLKNQDQTFFTVLKNSLL